MLTFTFVLRWLSRRYRRRARPTGAFNLALVSASVEASLGSNGRFRSAPSRSLNQRSLFFFFLERNHHGGGDAIPGFELQQANPLSGPAGFADGA